MQKTKPLITNKEVSSPPRGSGRLPLINEVHQMSLVFLLPVTSCLHRRPVYNVLSTSSVMGRYAAKPPLMTSPTHTIISLDPFLTQETSCLENKDLGSKNRQKPQNMI